MKTRYTCASPPGNRENQENVVLVIGKNKTNMDILLLKRVKFEYFSTGYSLNPRKSVNSCHFYRFLVFFFTEKFGKGYGSTF